MFRVILISFGSVFLGLGIIGIVVPGLPTTPFLLLSAGCYVRSSERLYNWLINHKVFGRYVKTFYEHKAMTVRAKVISLLSMWSMIIISLIFAIHGFKGRIIILIAAVIGSIVVLKIKTFRK